MIKDQDLKPGINKQTSILSAERAPGHEQIKPGLHCNEGIINEYEKTISRYKNWEANIPAIVYLLKMSPDERFEFIHISSASKKLLGLEPEDIVKNLHVLTDLIEPDDFENFIKESRNSARSLTRLKYEARFKIKGELLWFEFTSSPEPQADGSTIWNGIMLDITGRKTEEEKISIERNLMFTLMENIPDVIYFKDLESRFIKINKGFLKKFNISSEKEILMKTDFDIFSFEHANDARTDELKIIETGNSIINKIEKETHPSGKTNWVSSTKIPLKDTSGKIIGTFGVSRDITEWVQIKNILAEEHNLMSTIINTIPDDIFVKDLEGRFIINNTAHIKTMGIHSQDKIKDKTEFDLIPYETAKIHSDDDLLIIKTGNPLLNKEEKIFTGANQPAWQLTTKVPLTDQNKSIIGIVGISHNITDIKNIQEKLKSSEARFRNINNAVSAILYSISITGEDLSLVWVGENIKQFGYNNEEILTLEWSTKIIHPDDIEYYKSNLSFLFSKVRSVIEYRIRHKDGHFIWLRDEMVLCYDFNGKPSEIFGSWLDITEQMAAEEALLNSETQLANAMNIARLGHWEYDIVNDLLTLNDLYYSLFHTTVEKEGGYTMSISKFLERFVYPDDVVLLKNEIQTAINSKDPNFNGQFEHRIVYAEGKTGYFTVNYFVIKNEEGKSVKANGVVQDITERVLREQEKLELENQLKLRNTELEKMITDLKHMQKTLVRTEKMASIGQLSAGIAHEINNPLAYVASSINRLKEYFDDTLQLLQKWQNFQPALKDNIEFAAGLQDIDNYTNEIDFNFILQNYDRIIKSIQEGGQRIKKIVEGMRGFAHSSGTSFAEANINQAIDDTLTIVWNELKYKATIDKNFQELPKVSCNIGEIKQVLVNLLVNAAHSIQEQGKISIATYQDSESVFIKIKDTGCGIAEENIKRIFDPFFTTKRIGEGTGLGLWICSTIIEKHNGSLTVESSIGNGSTFIVRLPISQETDETKN